MKQNFDFSALENNLVSNFDKYQSAYRNEFLFNGPSLYFHKKALALKYPRNIEMIYAVLVSWGMHRMGRGGAKMVDFQIFESSLKSLELNILSFQSKKISEMKEGDINSLEPIFNGIKVMNSNSRLVAHSKVLAHILPDIVPPIDRRYTLNFFEIRNSFQVKWRNNEWDLFKLILNFFQRVSTNKDFIKKSNECVNKFEWDTSIPKIIDNLIIGRGVLELSKARQAGLAKRTDNDSFKFRRSYRK